MYSGVHSLEKEYIGVHRSTWEYIGVHWSALSPCTIKCRVGAGGFSVFPGKGQGARGLGKELCKSIPSGAGDCSVSSRISVE